MPNRGRATADMIIMMTMTLKKYRKDIFLVSLTVSIQKAKNIAVQQEIFVLRTISTNYLMYSY